MGLFNRSPKPPQPPLPILQLHIHKPQDHIFRPNDTITGHISLHVPETITPQAIHVSFWGHSSVWLRTSHTNSNDSTEYIHYRDNFPLFTVSQNLLKDPCVLDPDKAFEWPFEFRVPEGTGFDRRGAYKNDVDSRWTVAPHLLPPSFFTGTYPEKHEYPDHAEVNYGVTAQLICPGVGTGKHGADPLSATAPVLFQPTNPHAHLLAPGAPLSVVKHPKSFKLQSSALTGQDPRSIGFRQRVHDRFSSSTPSLTFELGIEVPDLLTSSAEFKFRTSFSILEKNDKVSHVPPIRISIKKLELLDFTFARAQRDFEAMSNMSGDHYKKASPNEPNTVFSGQEHIMYEEHKTLLNSIPEQQILELEEREVGPEKGDEDSDVKRKGEERVSEQAQQAECWFVGRVPGFTPPAFTSWAITRVYRIRVKVGVEIGEKKFAHEIESHIRHLGA